MCCILKNSINKMRNRKQISHSQCWPSWGPGDQPHERGHRPVGALGTLSGDWYSTVQYSTVQYSGGTRDTLRGLVHRNLANKATMAEN